MAAIHKRKRSGNPVIRPSVRRWLVRGMWLALLVVVVVFVSGLFLPDGERGRRMSRGEVEERLERAAKMEAEELWLAAAEEYETISRSARAPREGRIAADEALATLYAERLGQPHEARRTLEHAYYLAEDEDRRAALRARLDELEESAPATETAGAGAGGRGETSPPAKPANAVAQVGSRYVTIDEIRDALVQQTRRSSASKEELEQFTQQYLQMVAISEAARAEGLDRRPEVADAIRAYEDQLLVREMLEQVETADPTEEEVQRFYEQYREEFRAPAAASVGHIVVRNEEESREVGRRLAQGEPFEDVAREMSLDAETLPNATQVGAVSADDRFIEYIGIVPEELPGELLAMEIGATTGPLETSRGYHWLQVQGKREAGPRPLTQVKDQVEQALRRQRALEAQREIVAEAVSKIPVRVDEARLAQEIAKVGDEAEPGAAAGGRNDSEGETAQADR